MGVDGVKKLRGKKYKKFKNAIVIKRLTPKYLYKEILNTVFNTIPILLYLKCSFLKSRF